ncbi:PilZ domain-containing protein [Acanthopleuribacter pedis]|uniref:PilZ domain-containing protein n=1 Tax=Acanthopleuribacter pedis TaxID=442870 RepID=A0A8J7U359_9BACT|nr:PilZ domain-containing protein [Acanthopleuribacter pedis]MBO1320043.1 PilZ domain-containing protein [Acanthopleuribacter pedis]
MSQESENRRNFERFHSEMSICWIRPIGEGGDFLLAEITNISAGGLLFQLDYPMKAGQELEVRFELPQNDELVEAVAIVRHCKQEQDHLYFLGVQFKSVKNYSIPVLMAYLEALYK